MFHTHIYTYIHFHMYRIEPSRAVERLFSFFGVISASAGATGVKFSIQQLERVRTRERQKVKKEEDAFPFYLHNVMSILQHALTYFTV